MAIVKQCTTTKSTTMKNRMKTSTIILGIIVAVLALSNSNVRADTSETSEIKELKDSKVEMMSTIAHLLDVSSDSTKIVEKFKIFNNKSELIYESKDENDQRLKLLIRRSDLICYTDTSSYYLLDN